MAYARVNPSCSPPYAQGGSPCLPRLRERGGTESKRAAAHSILVVSRCRGIGPPSSGIVLGTLFLASWEYSSPLYCLISSYVGGC